MKIKNVQTTECGTGEITMEYAEKVFKELLAFQGYGFCLGYDVDVEERTKGVIPIGKIEIGDFILAPGNHSGDRWVEVSNVMPMGEKDVFNVMFENGKTLRCTADHKMLCEDGVMRGPLDAMAGRFGVSCHPFVGKSLSFSRIAGVSYLGMMPVMDITVRSRAHLFYANGFVVSNCKAHAVSYSVYSAVQMWLQEHYFIEYMCCLLDHIDRATEKKGHLILNERVEYCLKHGTAIRYPSVQDSTDHWQIKAGALLAPIKNIKGFSDKEVETIMSNRPYKDIADFLEKTKYKKNRFEPLLFAHAFDCLYDNGSGATPPENWIEDVYNWYRSTHPEEYEKKGGMPAKKRKTQAISLFDDEDPDEDESSSSMELVVFTRDELEEKCLDLNGFVIHDVLMKIYADYYSGGMKHVAKVTGNEEYGKRNDRIYSIGDILEMQVEEGRYKNCWTLASVQSVARDIPGKFGTFCKMTIGDGIDSTTIMCNSIPQVFQKGVVIVFPVSINDKGKIYVDNRTMEKLDPVVL